MKAHERPGFIPPFMDLETLSAHVCMSTTTIERRVRDGLFPRPKKEGGRNLWRWKEVERHLANPDEEVAASISDVERVREATRLALVKK